MDTNLSRALTRLSRGSFLHFDAGRGLSVFVLRGQLWATQFGDQRDLVVGRGRLLTLDRPGPALLEALEDTVLLFVAAVQPALPASVEPSLAAGRPEQTSVAHQRSTTEMTVWEAQLMARRLRAQGLVWLHRHAAAGLRGFWLRLSKVLRRHAAAAVLTGQRVTSHAQRV